MIFRIAALGGAILLSGAAWGQTAGGNVPVPTGTDASEAAELLYLETLRRAANNPMLDPESDSEDTILVVTERPDDVVCSWRKRNGSNFRERRCRSRFQAESEERQAAYAMRRLRGF